MSTPSPTSDDGAPEGGAAAPRPLRDRWLVRLAILLALFAAAGVATRSCASAGDVTQDEAVAIAVKAVDFEPECMQVRFYRAGVQSVPVWAVSLWTLVRGEFGRIAVVQVNGLTGDVVDVNLSADSPYTQPQCDSPV